MLSCRTCWRRPKETRSRMTQHGWRRPSRGKRKWKTSGRKNGMPDRKRWRTSRQRNRRNASRTYRNGKTKRKRNIGKSLSRREEYCQDFSNCLCVFEFVGVGVSIRVCVCFDVGRLCVFVCVCGVVCDSHKVFVSVRKVSCYKVQLDMTVCLWVWKCASILLCLQYRSVLIRIKHPMIKGPEKYLLACVHMICSYEYVVNFQIVLLTCYVCVQRQIVKAHYRQPEL